MWRRKYWRFQRYKLLVGLMLLSYVTTAMGVPLPVVAAKDLTQPFPCQDRTCGCRNAEQCWRQCCCTTLEQRLAWAKERGIEPPSFVQQGLVEKKPERSCCARKPAKACCSNAHAAPTSSSRHHHHQSDPTVDWVTAISSMQCQGINTLWVSAGAVLPGPYRLAWSPEVPTISVAPSAFLFAPSRPLSPPERPPRQG